MTNDEIRTLAIAYAKNIVDGDPDGYDPYYEVPGSVARDEIADAYEAGFRAASAVVRTATLGRRIGTVHRIECHDRDCEGCL